MLHNNHIIKTLSNTILSLALVCSITNTMQIQSMYAGIVTEKPQTARERIIKAEDITPAPPRPPFTK